jgi:hypothetical protein
MDGLEFYKGTEKESGFMKKKKSYSMTTEEAVISIIVIALSFILLLIFPGDFFINCLFSRFSCVMYLRTLNL